MLYLVCFMAGSFIGFTIACLAAAAKRNEPDRN